MAIKEAVEEAAVDPPGPAALPRAGRGAVLLVVFDAATLGFVTLGFEMVASRILTPLFGSGIYTWATIISIVVAGLMAGYFLGGFLADRFPTFLFAALIKLAAAACLLAVFSLTSGPLEAMIGGISDETTALFASGIAICFPPLLILGMYAPLSVRLLLRDPAEAGRIAGGLFAVSSLGNIAGIIVTTFQLIPSLGTRAITLGFATFLLLSALLSLGARLYRAAQ
jgi:predicted membrane-bound spermidine synthase